MFLSGCLLTATALGLLEIFMSFGPLDRGDTLDKAPVLRSNSVIAHAMGGINGIHYSNSREAFEQNYSKGFRVFEVDLMLTADGKIVACHDGIEAQYGLKIPVSTLTADQFKNTRFKGRYTPLELEDIARFLESFPDMYIVPDVKFGFEATYRTLVQQVSKRDPALLDRVIPQIYREEDYSTLKEIYGFRKMIYTLYRIPPTSRSKLVNYWVGRRVLRFIEGKEDIFAVTMFRLRFMKSGWLVRKLRSRDRDVFVHTLNDENEISGYLSFGATGIYTDDFTGWTMHEEL
jgi:glycerophosphoryl diester phosphodiesterase